MLLNVVRSARDSRCLTLPGRLSAGYCIHTRTILLCCPDGTQPTLIMSNTSHLSSAAPSVTSPVTASSTRKQPNQAERTADARKVFLNSLTAASSEVDAELKTRAKTIHANQAVVSRQDAELKKQITQLAKENAETEKWLSKSKQKLAEFEDWGELGDGLEDDLNDLEAMLDILEAQGKSSKESET